MLLCQWYGQISVLLPGSGRWNVAVSVVWPDICTLTRHWAVKCCYISDMARYLYCYQALGGEMLLCQWYGQISLLLPGTGRWNVAMLGIWPDICIVTRHCAVKCCYVSGMARYLYCYQALGGEILLSVVWSDVCTVTRHLAVKYCCQWYGQISVLTDANYNSLVI